MATIVPLATRIHKYVRYDYVVSIDDPEDAFEYTWEETDVVDILDECQLTTCSHAWWQEVLLDDGSTVEGHICNAAAQIEIDLYKVKKVGIDGGETETPVRVFGNEQDAVDFMLSWTGDGDYLRLYHGYRQLGSVDLWYNPGVYQPYVAKLSAYGSSSYDEMPF